VSLAPLVAGRLLVMQWLDGEATRSRFIREAGVGFGAIAVGTAFGQSLRVFASVHDTSFAPAPPVSWPSAWAQLSESLARAYAGSLPPLAAAAALGLLWLAVPATRAAAVRYWAGMGALVLTLMATLAATGMTDWAARNGYSPRYLFLGVFGVTVGLAAVAVGPAVSLLGETGRRLAAAVVAAALPGIAIAAFGPPSVGAVRAAIDRTAGRWTDDLLAAECTHLGGDYWHVWPAVFHANLTLADRGEDRRVWGVTRRSAPTRPQWRAVPADRTRIGWLLPPPGQPPGDSDLVWRAEFPEVRKVAERPTLWVFILEPE
jgi:hypothetical protein